VAFVRRLRFRIGHLAVVSLGLAAVSSGGACRRARLPRGDAAAVVVVAPRHDAPSARSLEEHEPNDSPDKAQLLVLNPEWPVMDLEGSLASQTTACDSDVDVFKLLIPGEGPTRDKAASPIDSALPADPRLAARRLALELAPEGATSLSLQVLDDGLKALETVSAENGQAAGMPNLAVQPGRFYYFRVRASSKTGKSNGPPSPCKYKFSIELGNFGVGDEREPNDSADTAEVVTMVGLAELAGFHGWPRDQDFYRILAPEVASALDVVLDGVEGVSPGLQVLDGNGARLAHAKGRKGERLELHNVRISAAGVDAGANAQFVHVVVRNEAGQNRTQRYVLHLALGAINPGVEIEPNDTSASATPVRDGTISGFLPAGDVDYFVYDRRESRDLSVDVAFPARVRGRVELARMGKAETVASAESSKAHQNVTLPKVASLGQPLLIRIACGKGDGNANEPYVLQITSALSAAQ
jgi:hypothetical protein